MDPESPRIAHIRRRAEEEDAYDKEEMIANMTYQGRAAKLAREDELRIRRDQIDRSPRRSAIIPTTHNGTLRVTRNEERMAVTLHVDIPDTGDRAEVTLSHEDATALSVVIATQASLARWGTR